MATSDRTAMKNDTRACEFFKHYHIPFKGQVCAECEQVHALRALLDAFERETRVDEVLQMPCPDDCKSNFGLGTLPCDCHKSVRIADLAAQPTPEVKKVSATSELTNREAVVLSEMLYAAKLRRDKRAYKQWEKENHPRHWVSIPKGICERKDLKLDDSPFVETKPKCGYQSLGEASHTENVTCVTCRAYLRKRFPRRKLFVGFQPEVAAPTPEKERGKP